MKTLPETGEWSQSWNVCFAADDVDAATAKAVEAGGKVLRDPFDTPGPGRMAVLADPQGAEFEVIGMPEADA